MNHNLVIILLLYPLLIGCSGRVPGSSRYGIEPVEITDHNFQATVLESPVPVVVDVWAPWCAPCVQMAPDVRRLAAELEGRAVVGKLNVDDNFAVARRYQIQGVPTILFFSHGKLFAKMVGKQSLADLRLQVQEMLKQEPASESR